MHRDSIELDAQLINDEAIQRALAIDQLFEESFGSLWGGAKRSWEIAIEPQMDRRNLWRLYLLVAAPLRILAKHPSSRDVARAALKQYAECPPTLIPLGGAPGYVAILCGHELVTDDLEGAWHPDFGGRVLCGLAAAEIRRDRLENLDLALALVEEMPRYASLVRRECAAVTLLSANPPLEVGKCISLTSKSVPGIVYVSDAPPILTAESLIHESAHLALMGYERCMQLYADPSRRVQTPLRADGRPVSGLLHQVFVLLHLVGFYGQVQKVDREDVQRNLRQIAKRADEHARDLRNGIEQLHAHRDALSAAGLATVQRWLGDSWPKS